MLSQVLASVAFGLIKGFVGPRAQGSVSGLQQNFLGPLREEAVYRAAPLSAFGGSLPYGSTAAMFAADHVVSDMRRGPMTAGQIAARFGDVLLGGLLYEQAYQSSGIVGAVTAHSLHNVFVGVGERLRNRK